MSSTKTLFISLALLVAPAVGCKERSNTVIQNQDITTGQGTGAYPTPGQQGSDTNAYAPNPTHVGIGEPMGSAAMTPPAGDNPMAVDAGVAGGAAASGADRTSGASSGSGRRGARGSAPPGDTGDAVAPTR